ncbi:MAG: glycosyltransferase [Candidatus Schekmanbacteria bacterium]|nr:MAG: glycosyltransferase [Candidatus Schekmanbacteria bacterium]
MEILHIYKDYYPVLGGIENHIKMLAESQAKLGHNVRVLVTNQKKSSKIETINGVTIIKASRFATVASTPLSITLPFKLKKEKPDIVHMHFPYPVGETAYLFSGIKAKTVITYHSDIVKQKYIAFFYRPILNKVLQKTDVIIATSDNYIKQSPILSKFKDKCKVIPLGIDLDDFKGGETEKSKEIRNKYGTPLLLFVGKLRYYKGLPYLIKAMNKIDASLVIVGSGPKEKELKELAKELNLLKKIHFTGDIDYKDLPDYYRACDIFILPSTEKSEAFGTVLLEAMAAEKPIISTELHTGTSYVNINNKTGLVVEPADSDAIVRAVEKLLKNEKLMKEFGKNAYERVSSNFSLEIMTKRIIDLYHSL